jgi:hypothetical protein
MKLFSKPIKYQLITNTTWGNYVDVPELVIEGTRADIDAYAKKSLFVWEQDSDKPLGGHYVRSIDGYQTKIYDIVEAK